MTTQTNEALKLALEALKFSIEESNQHIVDPAITAIKEALANHIPDATKMVAQQSNEQVEPVGYADKASLNYLREGLMEKIALVNKESAHFDDETGDDVPLYTHPPVPMAQREPTKQEHDILMGALKRSSKVVDNGQPKEPEQEPVGEAYLCDRCHTPFDMNWECPACGHNMATKEPVYTTPPQRKEPEQEPVAWIRRHPNGALSNEVLIHVQVETVRRNSGAWVPLYTTPPQRKPLTDEEIDALLNSVDQYVGTENYPIKFARAIEAAHGIKE